MTLTGGLQTLLHRYSGQDAVAVGIPVAGRTHRETEGLIGFFVNTLVVRGDLSGNPSFRTLLGRIKQKMLRSPLPTRTCRSTNWSVPFRPTVIRGGVHCFRSCSSPGTFLCLP